VTVSVCGDIGNEVRENEADNDDEHAGDERRKVRHGGCDPPDRSSTSSASAAVSIASAYTKYPRRDRDSVISPFAPTESPAKRRVHHEPIHFGPVNNASDGSRDEATDDPSDEQDDYCADESGQEGDDIRYALFVDTSVRLERRSEA